MDRPTLAIDNRNAKTFLTRTATWLDRWSWVILAAAAPFLLFPAPSRSAALLVVPGLWIVTLIARRAPLPVTPLNGSILLVAVMVLVSLWATYDLSISLPKISGMVLGMGIYFAFCRWGQRRRGWWICLGIFLICGLGMALVGLLGMDWTSKIRFLIPITSRLSSQITGLPGAESGFHPNEVAGLLLWLVPPFVILSIGVASARIDMPLHRSIRIPTKTVLAIFLWGCTLASAGILVLTQSRGALLGLSISLAVVTLFMLPKRVRWYAIGCLSIASFAFILFLLNGGLRTAVNQLFVDSQVQSGMPVTLDQRIEIWSRAVLGIQFFPITGMGMNTFRTVVPRLFPLFTVSPSMDIGHAHNEFLQAALDLGLPGLIAFLGLYWGAFAMLLAVWKSLQGSRSWEPASPISPPFGKFLAAGLAGGLLAHMIYGLFDAIALGAKPGVLFWMLLGLTAALYTMTAKSPNQSAVHTHDD